jgi:hypothetical protein
VAELHRRADHQVGAELVGQGAGHLDAQLSVLVDADGFIPASFARLPVGGQKHPRRIPLRPPLPFGHVGGVEVVAGAPQSFPTQCDRRATCR